MRLPPIMMRLNSCPAILPIGIGPPEPEAAISAAPPFCSAACAALSPSGSAADARREDLTKPRRENCRFMAMALSAPGCGVKRQYHVGDDVRSRSFQPIFWCGTRTPSLSPYTGHLDH